MSSATNSECNDPSMPMPRPTKNRPNINRTEMLPTAKQIQPIIIGKHDISVVALRPMYSQIKAVTKLPHTWPSDKSAANKMRELI